MSARFTVTWEQELHDQLTERWLAAIRSERIRLTQITDRIDRELRYSPARRGRPITGRLGFRVWRVPAVEPPVLVVFEVRPTDRTVNVVQMLLFPA